jgi:hypothetical protein
MLLMEKNEFYAEGLKSLVSDLRSLAMEVLRLGSQVIIPLLYIKHIGKIKEYKEFEKQMTEKYFNGSSRHN